MQDLTLSSLAPYGPHLLVYVVGGILAVGAWRRHPLPSALALAGILVKVLATLLQLGAGRYFAHMSTEQGFDSAQLHARLAAFGLIDGLLHAVGLALIVAAVFAGRRGP